MNAINSDSSNYDSMFISKKWTIDIISSLFQCIAQVLSDDDLDNVDQNYYHFLDRSNHKLVGGDEYHSHLPLSAYSYIRPIVGVRFILHGMLYMGRF